MTWRTGEWLATKLGPRKSRVHLEEENAILHGAIAEADDEIIRLRTLLSTVLPAPGEAEACPDCSAAGVWPHGGCPHGYDSAAAALSSAPGEREAGEEHEPVEVAGWYWSAAMGRPQLTPPGSTVGGTARLFRRIPAPEAPEGEGR